MTKQIQRIGNKKFKYKSSFNSKEYSKNYSKKLRTKGKLVRIKIYHSKDDWNKFYPYRVFYRNKN